MQIREERLFERIRRLEQIPPQPIESNADTLKRSVTGHLRHILNSRQGSVQIADDYGVPDFMNLTANFGKDSVAELEDTIRHVILKYEPRLADIRVTHHEEQKNNLIGLTFRLEANIRYRDKEIPVIFETVLEPDGQISITS